MNSKGLSSVLMTRRCVRSCSPCSVMEYTARNLCGHMASVYSFSVRTSSSWGWGNRGGSSVWWCAWKEVELRRVRPACRMRRGLHSHHLQRWHHAARTRGCGTHAPARREAQQALTPHSTHRQAQHPLPWAPGHLGWGWRSWTPPSSPGCVQSRAAALGQGQTAQREGAWAGG